MLNKSITPDEIAILSSYIGKYFLDSNNRLYQFVDYKLGENDWDSSKKNKLTDIDIKYCDTSVLQLFFLSAAWIKSNLDFTILNSWRNRYLFVQNQYKFFNLELVDYKDPSHTKINVTDEKI